MTDTGPSYDETFDVGECVVSGCSEVADSTTREASCGCAQTVVNCMRGHRVIVSIIQPPCRTGGSNA